MSDTNSGAFDWQNDPFGEDFYVVPDSEEIWARIERVAEDNRDALRHFVELSIWEALDNPDFLKVLLSLLWLWEDVDPRWLAEASFKSVGDVRDLVESQPVVFFNCLYCGVELKPMNRRHLLRIHHSQKAHSMDEGDDPPPICSARRASHKGPTTPKIKAAWTSFGSKPSLPNIAAGPTRSAGKRRSGRS